LNRHEETAQALRNGWMHTGDGGFMDESGYVFIVDCMKDMIITGGENGYSVEVEKVITSHPSVAICAVIGLPDPIWGERVHVVVQTGPGSTVSLEESVPICRERISGYKSPRSLSLVDSMVLSPAGKTPKRELRAQARNSSMANAT
jgi:acyl-CoA synthetase (AMP-forming)/AMP-acid ligase II